MSQNLPPPVALRAFEAAARHLSFTRAAAELSVTQAAVSHQIRVLEEYLHAPLFTRLPRRLLLTEQGQSLYAVVGEYFSKLAEVTSDIKSTAGGGVLNVSLTPYFSAKWLTIRLSEFWNRHPNIDLRLHHVARPDQLDRPDIDVAISWARDKWPGAESKLLLSARVLPVCSPKIITRNKPLKIVDDLYNHTLLHEQDYSLWSLWLKRAGIKNVNLKRGSTLDDSNVILQAAIDGQGVALGADMLLTDELHSGRLVMPFDPSISTRVSYYILYRQGAMKNPVIATFCNWLLNEARGAGKTDPES